MNELIKVNYDTEHPTVSARELHKALEVSSRFSRWFDTNKEMFVDGEDYNKCTSSTVVNNGAVREQTMPTLLERLLRDWQKVALTLKLLWLIQSTDLWLQTK